MPAPNDPVVNLLDAQDRLRAEKEAEAEKKRQEEAHVQRLFKKVLHAKKHDKRYRERWADDRRVARGEPEPGEKHWDVRANLIGAIMEVLQAFLYAKNPDVSIKPSESVDRKRIPEYRKIAETLQIIVSRLFHDARLKRHAKRWVRNAMTVGISWIKLAMQTRKFIDPQVIDQINDLQQQLDGIQAQEVSKEDQDGEDRDVTESEINSKIISLEARRERRIADGAVIDVMAPEDVTVAPECGEVENYLAAPWISFDYYKDKDDILILTKWTSQKDLELLAKANVYHERPRDGEIKEGGESRGTYKKNQGRWLLGEEGSETSEGFYRVIEIWHKKDGVVYTLIDGVTSKFAIQPYAPRTGMRFYPCFALGFHYIDGERHPQGDVFQLKPMQNEYNRTRSNFAEHRERAVPGMIFDKGAVDETSIAALQKSERQEYIGIDFIEPGTDIRTVIAVKLYNPVDLALYDTEPITREMEKVSGAQEAVQSGLAVEKTATEARIQEGGRGARNSNRQDELEDTLTEMAEYLTQLVLQIFEQTDAEKYAGSGAAWVDMTTEQALTMFNVTIKAGSTGKPKANSDREIWGTLMPLIEGMIDRVGQARVLGQEWAAKPWIALLDETMRRLDDPAPIEKFLPVPPEADEPGEDESSELEKSEIDLNKSRAMGARADVIEKLSTMMTREQAATLLFFGFDAGAASVDQIPQGQAPIEQPDLTQT